MGSAQHAAHDCEHRTTDVRHERSGRVRISAACCASERPQIIGARLTQVERGCHRSSGRASKPKLETRDISGEYDDESPFAGQGVSTVMIGPEIRERVLHSSGLVIALACACTCTLACTERSEPLEHARSTLYDATDGAGTSTCEQLYRRGHATSAASRELRTRRAALPAPRGSRLPVLVSALSDTRLNR